MRSHTLKSKIRKVRSVKTRGFISNALRVGRLDQNLGVPLKNDRVKKTEGAYTASGVVYVATGNTEYSINKSNQKGFISETIVKLAIQKWKNSDPHNSEINVWTTGKKIVNIGDKQFYYVPGSTVRPSFKEKKQSEVEASRIAENLSKELDRPVLVYENIIDAFNYNANNGGSSYGISIDNMEISIAALKMLTGFKKSYFQHKALMAQNMNTEKGNSFALSVGPSIESIKLELFKNNLKPTLQNIADKLEEQNVLLPYGKTNWTPAAVKRIFERYQQLSK